MFKLCLNLLVLAIALLVCLTIFSQVEKLIKTPCDPHCMYYLNFHTGQASSSTASQAGALAEGIAELGWNIASKSKLKVS